MKKQKLEKQILQKELLLKNMNLNKASSDIYNTLYNTLILEKAVLKKELEELNKNKFVEGIKKVFSKNEKLICDYFK